MEKFTIEWQAHEFNYREKSVSWYWLSIIASVAILSVAVWQKNFLFAIFVVIAEILVLVWAQKKPRIVDFRIDEKGLTVDGKKFYPYSSIGAFGIKEDVGEGWSELAFRFSHGLRPLLKIRIPSERVAETERVLKTIVEKTEFEDSLLDSIEKLTGF
ncbi:MAG: hypothetical protein Q8O66_02900 [bacterium]|nr:hypothetical protein [bacterium]